jgi:phospholipase C
MASMTRRDALRLLGIAGLAMAGGCTGSEEDDASTQDGALGSCRGDTRVQDSASTSPPELRRYEKIVVLMMENRSFDHYFGHLSMPRALGGEGRTDVDGLKGNEVQYLTRPGSDGREVFKPFRATHREIGDIGHEWRACHAQFNGGAMDGFIQHHFEDLQRETRQRLCGDECAQIGDPMAYYGRTDTPVLHELFDNYALCDRWFSSVMGPTWPNRSYLHAGTSTGIKENARIDVERRPTSPTQARTIWHELKEKCISAANYSMDFAWALGGFGLFNPTSNRSIYRHASSGHGRDNNAPQQPSFEEACEEGTLPTVSIIDPAFILAPCDDHPPHDIKAGQAFISTIYKLLTKNPEQWAKTLFIITYDEHGSFYDHVTPPRMEADENPEFRQLGFRVPSLVIGPYVKKNYVSHVQYDHVSFLSTVTRRFGLDPLNARVAATNDVRDCIDMNLVETAGLPSAPAGLRSVRLSESLVHASIRDSLGQSELANVTLGRPATLEQKKRATDQMLHAFDRLGVATIRG